MIMKQTDCHVTQTYICVEYQIDLTFFLSSSPIVVSWEYMMWDEWIANKKKIKNSNKIITFLFVLKHY